MIIAICIVIAITFPLAANDLTLQTNNFTLDKRNRDDWIRTSGPFVPNEVRYQAALHPVIALSNQIQHITSKRKLQSRCLSIYIAC